MTRLVRLVSLGVLLLGATGILAGPENPITPSKGQVGIGSTWTKTVTFKGGERATVIVLGENLGSHLGLYIWDQDGNCVARDDGPGGKYLNDRAVIWYPAQKQQYTITVRNLGNVQDTFDVAIR